MTDGRGRDQWDKLPLFASDREIGTALMGAKRAGEFTPQAELLSQQGFPPIDWRFGGRYVPAVKAFFDREYGLIGGHPGVPGGSENLEAWNFRKKRKPTNLP